MFSNYELKREPEVTVKKTVSQQEPIEEAVPHALTDRIKQGKNTQDKKSDKALEWDEYFMSLAVLSSMKQRHETYTKAAVSVNLKLKYLKTMHDSKELV